MAIPKAGAKETLGRGNEPDRCFVPLSGKAPRQGHSDDRCLGQADAHIAADRVMDNRFLSTPTLLAPKLSEDRLLRFTPCSRARTALPFRTFQ